MRSMHGDWCPWDDEMVQVLGDGGALVFDGVLGKSVASDTFQQIVELAREGALRNAGVGRMGSHRQDESVRQDLIAWVDADTEDRFTRISVLFEQVRQAANEYCWMGVKRFDTQIAMYPGDGAQYDRHRDAFHGQMSRVLTAIYYPNVDWQPAHGGQLRVFFSNGTVEEIEPMGDRLVVFLSEILDHQVLPVFSARAALTAWYYP